MANVKIKLLHVLNLLLNTDEQHTMNATQMVDRLFKDYNIVTERKSVCRDVATLKAFGYDIIADKDKRKGWYYGKRRFDNWQIFMFLSAFMEEDSVTRTDLRNVFNELIKDLGPNDTEMFRNLLPMFVRLNKKSGTGTGSRLKGVLSEILLALSWNKSIEFQIYGYDKSLKSVLRRGSQVYRVDPYSLVLVDSNYYLIGAKEDSEVLEFFRLDHMANPHATGSERRSIKEFVKSSQDPQKYFKKLVEDTFNSKEKKYKSIKISFKNESELIDCFVEQFGIPEEVGEGEEFIEVTLKDVNVGDNVLNWLILHSNEFEVVYPEKLRDCIKRELKARMDFYKD